MSNSTKTQANFCLFYNFTATSSPKIYFFLKITNSHSEILTGKTLSFNPSYSIVNPLVYSRCISPVAMKSNTQFTVNSPIIFT